MRHGLKDMQHERRRKFMQITCNKCEVEFELKKKLFKRRKIADGIEEIYLECPDCKAEYHSYYENEKVKEIMAKNKELQNELVNGTNLNTRTTEQLQDIQDKIIENKKAIMREQNKIKKKLGVAV